MWTTEKADVLRSVEQPDTPTTLRRRRTLRTQWRGAAKLNKPRKVGKGGRQKEERKRRHEGGVEPLALSRSTDLKSAPRTDEDHHGPCEQSDAKREPAALPIPTWSPTVVLR